MSTMKICVRISGQVDRHPGIDARCPVSGVLCPVSLNFERVPSRGFYRVRRSMRVKRRGAGM